MTRPKRPAVYVEGKNDFHALITLLIKRGINYDLGQHRWPPHWPEFNCSAESGGVVKLLALMPEGVRNATAKSPVGFVVDADTDPGARWDAVRDRLDTVGVGTPTEPPTTGFVGTSTLTNARVGVWLMPDNRNPGYIEDFLMHLVPDSALVTHAETATDEATKHGATFKEIHRVKAVLRVCLPWQEAPGLPYGTAIRADFMDATRESGDCFETWFRDLFAIDRANPASPPE